VIDFMIFQCVLINGIPITLRKTFSGIAGAFNPKFLPSFPASFKYEISAFCIAMTAEHARATGGSPTNLEDRIPTGLGAFLRR